MTQAITGSCLDHDIEGTSFGGSRPGTNWRGCNSSHLSRPDARQARATRDEALEITRGLIERVLVKHREARGSFEAAREYPADRSSPPVPAQDDCL